MSDQSPRQSLVSLDGAAKSTDTTLVRNPGLPGRHWLMAMGIALVGVIVFVGLAVVNLLSRLPVNLAAPPAVTREIGFTVEGDGVASYAAVWTTRAKYWPVASMDTRPYEDPITAVMTIYPAKPGIEAWCDIWVDGVLVDREPAAANKPATCVWIKR